RIDVDLGTPRREHIRARPPMSTGNPDVLSNEMRGVAPLDAHRSVDEERDAGETAQGMLDQPRESGTAAELQRAEQDDDDDQRAGPDPADDPESAHPCRRPLCRLNVAASPSFRGARISRPAQRITGSKINRVTTYSLRLKRPCR